VHSISMVVLLAFDSVAMADCLASPILSVNLNDYARCHVQNVGRRSIDPISVYVSGVAVDNFCDDLGHLDGYDPSSQTYYPNCFTTSHVNIGGNSVVFCSVCSPGWTAKRLRESLQISVCAIPSGSNRCDSTVVLAPPK
jgi:hypothetical protein